MRIRRTRGQVIDYVASLSPLGFATAFTRDAAQAGQFSPDECSLAQSNYAMHPSAGVLTVEAEKPPEAVRVETAPKPEPKRAGRR